MIEVHVNYYFKNNDDRDKFYKEALDEGIIQMSKEEPGNIRYDFYLPLCSDAKIFLLEQWQDQEALDLHGNMDHFKRFQDIKAKYLTNFEIMKYDGVNE